MFLLAWPSSYPPLLSVLLGELGVSEGGVQEAQDKGRDGRGLLHQLPDDLQLRGRQVQPVDQTEVVQTSTGQLLVINNLGQSQKE